MGAVRAVKRDYGCRQKLRGDLVSKKKEKKLNEFMGHLGGNATVNKSTARVGLILIFGSQQNG